MALTYGFYDSLNHDRVYSANQMSTIFNGIITDGVFQNIGEHFSVIAGTGMQVIVKPGRAWFDGTWTLLDTDYALSINASNALLSRIDAVVLETNFDVETRANSIKVVAGTPSTTPVAPTLESGDLVNQHVLAYVSVAAGATAITNSMIDIQVGVNKETPYITSVLQQTNITELYLKWEDEWYEWFNNVKTTLSGDVAANLQANIDSMAAEIDNIGDRYLVKTTTTVKNEQIANSGGWVIGETLSDYLGVSVSDTETYKLVTGIRFDSNYDIDDTEDGWFPGRSIYGYYDDILQFEPTTLYPPSTGRVNSMYYVTFDHKYAYTYIGSYNGGFIAPYRIIPGAYTGSLSAGIPNLYNYVEPTFLYFYPGTAGAIPSSSNTYTSMYPDKSSIITAGSFSKYMLSNGYIVLDDSADQYLTTAMTDGSLTGSSIYVRYDVVYPNLLYMARYFSTSDTSTKTYTTIDISSSAINTGEELGGDIRIETITTSSSEAPKIMSGSSENSPNLLFIVGSPIYKYGRVIIDDILYTNRTGLNYSVLSAELDKITELYAGYAVRIAFAADSVISTTVADNYRSMTYLIDNELRYAILASDTYIYQASSTTLHVYVAEQAIGSTTVRETIGRLSDVGPTSYGCYYGTGTYGADYPNSITFTHRPKIVFMLMFSSIADDRVTTINTVTDVKPCIPLEFCPSKYLIGYGLSSDSAYAYGRFDDDTNTYYWYGEDAYSQYNTAAVAYAADNSSVYLTRYYWVAFG